MLVSAWTLFQFCMCKKTGAHLAALQEDCLGLGGDSCGKAERHLSSPCERRNRENMWVLFSEERHVALPAPSRPKIQRKSETKPGIWLKWCFESACNVRNFDNQMLGTSTTILRNLVGFVIILQAHIGLRKENAPGLWLPWVAWAVALWLWVCSGSWTAAAVCGHELVSQLLPLPLSCVLHFATWLQLKIVLHLPFFLLYLDFISLLKKRWLLFLLPLGKPGVSFSFLN